MAEEIRVATTVEVVEAFNRAFNLHDVPAIMDLMTEDCVFENTSPFPDGERYEGQAVVRKFWEDFFRSSPQATFQNEDQIVSGDRCVVRWIYSWSPEGHIRGVDVFRVRDGKVAEKFSYVKG